MLIKVLTKIRQSLNQNHNSATTAPQQRHSVSGFTLAELMIATTILALIVTFSATIYLNFFGSVRNLKAANLVYEEARFTMERIVKEIRNGTIDYEEYYNQNLVKGRTGSSYDYILNDTYAQDYCQYSRQFYNYGPDGEIGTLDDESIGRRVETDSATGEDVPPAIGRWSTSADEYVPDPIQNDLYIINVNGDRRSFIKRIEKFDSQGNSIGKIGLLKLIGEDFGVDHINALDPDLDPSTTNSCSADAGENDGRIDTWLCEDGYECEDIILPLVGDCSNGVSGQTIFGQNIIIDPNILSPSSFVDITPTSLDIVDLRFIISPMDDPRKAYNDNSVQVQPHVTIKMIARANPKIAAQFKSDRTPDIVLVSTVSTRAQNPIITECNLRQCTEFSTPKSCPLSVGVCGPNPDGVPNPAPDPATQECVSFVWSGCSTDDYTTYADSEWGTGSYQAGSEFASCDADATGCIAGFCNDGMDNDCDGLTDEMDPECRFYLCNDGLWDVDVEGGNGCKDVGGLCQTIRPLEPEESSCYDGYDNDCDYEVIGTTWTEGTGADQFDSDCIAQYCSNGELDPGIGLGKRTVPNSTEPSYFLRLDYGDEGKGGDKGYLLNAKDSDTDSSLDETCIDVGPLCPTKALPEGSPETLSCEGNINCMRIVCSDGYDNDCDGLADELDDDCIAVICNDTKRNCDLIDTEYEFLIDPNVSEDYLKNYFNMNCGDTNLDEACKNVGGICDGYWDNDTLTYFDHTFLSNEKTPVFKSSDVIRLPSNTTDLCKDGLDNDCDTKIDWRDTDCCSDLDNDGYIGESDSCFVDIAESEGALIDCNDNDSNIRPGVAEVCDDAIYPIGHPLQGDPIDNNCSADGLIDSGWDNDDPACCIDTDGDDYGVADAYLSCDNNSAPDCDDSDANIYPGAFESMVSGNCFNEDGASGNDFPLNDSCAYSEITYGSITTTVPHANHIDWYADKNSTWLAWYASEESIDITGLSGETGIEAAKILNLYSASCCPDTVVTEICNDNEYGSYGSDENCNGLEGNDDHYCVTNDGRAFYEYFTDSAHGLSLETANGVIQDVNLGVITLADATDAGNVQSNTLSELNLTACTSSYQITINATETTPGSSDIMYQLSSDGGATWCTSVDCEGDDWFLSLPASITVDTGADPSATDVRWKAKLAGGGGEIPILSDVTITINNCS